MVALAYDPLSDVAPIVAGKGAGPLAEKILQIAEERGIPIQRDPGLLSFLMQVDLAEKIPPELYTAVAAVLAMVWTADKLSSDRSSDPP